MSLEDANANQSGRALSLMRVRGNQWRASRQKSQSQGKLWLPHSWKTVTVPGRHHMQPLDRQKACHMRSNEPPVSLCSESAGGHHRCGSQPALIPCGWQGGWVLDFSHATAADGGRRKCMQQCQPWSSQPSRTHSRADPHCESCHINPPAAPTDLARAQPLAQSDHR